MLTPALTIIKTANTAAAVPGQVIGLHDHRHQHRADHLHRRHRHRLPRPDVLDDAAYDDDAPTTAGTLAYTSPTLTWTGDLTPGAAVIITYSVTVHNPDTGDKLGINSVSSAAAGSSCPPGSVSAAAGCSIPVLTPALTITATADTATTTPGAVVDYTVTVTDTGQTPYAGATVTGPLGGVLDDAAYTTTRPRPPAPYRSPART